MSDENKKKSKLTGILTSVWCRVVLTVGMLGLLIYNLSILPGNLTEFLAIVETGSSDVVYSLVELLLADISLCIILLGVIILLLASITMTKNNRIETEDKMNKIIVVLMYSSSYLMIVGGIAELVTGLTSLYSLTFVSFTAQRLVVTALCVLIGWLFLDFGLNFKKDTDNIVKALKVSKALQKFFAAQAAKVRKMELEKANQNDDKEEEEKSN